MYDRLLVPTDGSPGMARVVEHAGDLAIAHDATVHALYVVDTASRSAAPMDATLDGVHGLVYEQGTTAVEAVERRVPDDVHVEGTVTEGSPGTQILECARRQDCDAIVMGTHGRDGLNRLLLGSVAECVVRRSPVPVITVRLDAQEA